MINSTTTKHIYQADGQNREWSYTFPLAASADLTIIQTAPDGTESEVSASFTLDAANQRVIYPTEASGLAPLAAGWKITLIRQTPQTQPLDLTRQGVFDAEALERALDRATMEIQELKEESARALKMNVSDTQDVPSPTAYLDTMQQIKIQTSTLAVMASADAQTAADAADSASASKTAAENAALQSSANATRSDASATQANSASALARKWATLTGETVNGTDYSAKHYALAAQEAYKSVGLEFSGVYDATATYDKNSLVLVETDEALTYYISLVADNTGNAVTDASYWALFGALEKRAGGGGGSGTMRQVIITGAQPLKVTLAKDTNIATSSNSKASNTSNVGTPYQAGAEDNTTNYWGSTEKVNAVSGVAWTAQRNLMKPVHKIRLRQGRYDGYRITSVKVQWQSDTKPIWSQSIDDTKWQDLGTFALRDACVWEELELAPYTPTTQFHAVRILANANGTSTTAPWALHCVQMLNSTPATAQVGALAGTVANGFDETSAPVDIPVFKPAYETLTLTPQTFPATVGVYVNQAGTLSLAGVQTGGQTKPATAATDAVFYDEQIEKNYIKTASGWTEFPRLAVGQLDYDANGQITGYRVYPCNARPWGNFIETLAATGGELVLQNNRSYRATLSSAVSFALPAPLYGQENYIQLYANVTATVPVTWGDVLFYNQYPGASLSAGQYEILFFYDENAGKWTAGVLAKAGV